MAMHNVSPFGLLQVQNDTNTNTNARGQVIIGSVASIAQDVMFCVCVILHLKKPKARNVVQLR